jgi:hypothetical protein
MTLSFFSSTGFCRTPWTYTYGHSINIGVTECTKNAENNRGIIDILAIETLYQPVSS